MRAHRFASAALLVATLAPPATAGVLGQAPPPVDSERLMRDLSVLAHDSMAGREAGSVGAERTREFLVGALEDAGFAAPVLMPFTWDGRRGVNVVASVPGAASTDAGAIVLTAHYDHLGVRDGEIYNGADDNASGVAALLEIGRHLQEAPLEHVAVLAFVDAEEEGLQGSRALVEDPPVAFERIVLNVNLDMVSRTNGVLWAGGAYHTPELRPILEALAERAPLDLRLGHDRPGAPEGADWTDSSDHAPFHRAGIPFVYFGVEDHVDYHEPTDDPDRIDPEEFKAAVQTILMGIRALDAALPATPSATR